MRTGPAWRLLALLLTMAALAGGCGRNKDDDTASDTSSSTVGATTGTTTAGSTDESGDWKTQSAAAVAAAPKPDAASAPALITVQSIDRRNGVIRERLVYGANGLRIAAQVCRPDDVSAHPLLLYQHAGFSGLQTEGEGIGLCTLMAARGYAVVMSAYRGEDGSDGTVEYCLGEVDDSVALLGLVRGQPWAQPGRLALVGVSHGGCITLRMLARGVVAQAAVSLAGPTDWAQLYAVAAARAAADPTDMEAVDFLAQANTLLGSPQANPDAWAARSPLADIGTLRGTAAPVLLLHGAQDATVPVAQACSLALAMGGMEASHLSERYVPTLNTARTTDPVPGCGTPQPAWAGGDHPRTRNWAGDRHLVVYDGLGHDDSLQGGYALADLVDFVAAKYPLTSP